MSLAFLCQIDNLFGSRLPKEVHDNAKELNKSGLLVMGEDNNTYLKIYRRMTTGSTTFFMVIANIIVNIWYTLLLNVYLLWFTYLGALSMLLIQLIGFSL